MDNGNFSLSKTVITDRNVATSYFVTLGWWLSNVLWREIFDRQPINQENFLISSSLLRKRSATLISIFISAGGYEKVGDFYSIPVHSSSVRISWRE